MSIEYSNESEVQVAGDEFIALATYVLAEMYVHPSAELFIRMVDPAEIQILNEQWLGGEGPTDVLSFPMDELLPGHPGAITPAGTLGDLVICPQVAGRQAQAAGHSSMDEMLLLTVHGILHLLGYDHAEPEEEKEMFDLQRRLLLQFLASRQQHD